MERQAILIAENLSIGYRTSKGTKCVHEGLSFQLLTGELTALIGVNGAGKSTLLRTLSSSQPALGGTLLLNGKPMAEYGERELSRTVGVVLTDKTQVGGLTVYELVALGRQPHTGFFGRLHKRDHAIIREMLAAVGIEHKATSYVAELSDGERQKAMIAKALVQECPLIILDEPTAFLDVVNRIEVLTLLHRLAVEQNKAILLSTHDIEQALVLSDRLWLLSKQHGLHCGVTEDVILSHHMDSIFPHESICFDYNHGSYYPKVTGKSNIVVKADDATLRHWAVNALNRNGFTCSDTPDDKTQVTLTVESADRLLLATAGKVETFMSFESLINEINKI
jgi:iron complex transport system ATP-binding protein